MAGLWVWALAGLLCWALWWQCGGLFDGNVLGSSMEVSWDNLAVTWGRLARADTWKFLMVTAFGYLTVTCLCSFWVVHCGSCLLTHLCCLKMSVGTLCLTEMCQCWYMGTYEAKQSALWWQHAGAFQWILWFRCWQRRSGADIWEFWKQHT